MLDARKPEPGVCRHCGHTLTMADYLGVIQGAMGKAHGFKCAECGETNIDYIKGENHEKKITGNLG